MSLPVHLLMFRAAILDRFTPGALENSIALAVGEEALRHRSFGVGFDSKLEIGCELIAE